MRTQYVVHAGSDIARFSLLRHAMLFAIRISKEDYPNHLIEVSDKTGLIGQYKNGQPTPEFSQHHINGIFR